MKVSYKALIDAATALRLEADTYRGRTTERADNLYLVAEALLVVANGAGVIEMEENIMKCKHDYRFHRYCAAKVCTKCGDHEGLARCYCGWSETSPSQGYQELIDMGETIEPEDY